MSKKFNRDDADKWHDNDIYVPKRSIFIGSVHVTESLEESGCDTSMAERAIKNLYLLESLSEDPITILMNNPGGDEYHMLAIYGAIKSCKSHVTIKVLGHAMSAGSVILQAADERIMDPFSRQMIHYGTWSVDSHSKTFQKWAEEGRKIDSWMENIYLSRIREKHPNYTLAKVKKMLNHDTFLSAEESVALGLADKVADYGE